MDVAVGNAIVAGIPAPLRGGRRRDDPGGAAEAIEIEAGAPVRRRTSDLTGTVTFARVLGAFMRYEVALADGLTVTISSHRRRARVSSRAQR